MYSFEGGEDTDRIYGLFLEAMKAAIWDESLSWGPEVTAQDILRILDLSQAHHVLPMVFEALYACPGAAELDPGIFEDCKRATVQSVMTQAVKTEEYLELAEYLREAGVVPLVVKGIVCRSLYPRPDYRSSGDEDVLCGEHQAALCHKAMIGFGMEPCGSGLDSYETPFRKPDSALYIELHKTLFAEDSPIFGECNRFFRDAFSRYTEVQIQGHSVTTLGHTDHMLYLIVHAFKHFLHSGFGIRQVSDMILFADAYGDMIDWEDVLAKCRSIRADKFAVALFRIGQDHLGFDMARCPQSWRQIQVDGEALLTDLLDGGIYGSADRSRVHSSNMTLNAVAADKKGKKADRSILRTVFPAAKSIEGRFPYLRSKPYLLPVAWTCRLFGYARESMTDPRSAAGDVIRTGSKRIELLREYDIID